MIKPYYDKDGITIYHGDCMDVLPQLPKVDLVITDPPYGINYFSNYYKYSNPHNRIINDDKLFLPIDNLWNILKDNGSLFSFYSHKKPIFDYRMKNIIVWVKNNWSAGDLKGDFGNQYENIAYMPKPNFKIRGKRLSNVWHCERNRPIHHPTEKPLELLKKIIKCSTDIGNIVCDPFMGSGTTLRAAKDLNRKAIGIEIEEKYCEIAVKRLAQEVFNFSK